MCLCRNSALTVLLLIVYSISICNGGCFAISAIPGLRGCMGYGVFVPFDTTIELQKCLKCHCSIDYLGCCWIKATHYYPEYCTEIPDGPCRTRVVMKHNTSLTCDSYGGVGVG